MENKYKLTAVGLIAAVAIGIYSFQSKDADSLLGAARPKPPRGGFTVNLDTASPLSSLVLAGGGYKVTALSVVSKVAEDLKLESLSFQYDGSNLAAVRKFDVLDENTFIGSGVFAGGVRTTTVILQPRPIIPAEGTKTLLIGVDTTAIGIGQPAGAGDTIAINYNGDDRHFSRAVGQKSAKIFISASKRDTRAKPIILFRSFPIVVGLAVPAPTTSGSSTPISRLQISAHQAGDVTVGKLTFKLKTEGQARVTNPKLMVFSDPGFFQVAAVPDTFEIKQTGKIVEIYAKSGGMGIRAGDSRYFELQGDIRVRGGGGKVSATFEGDKKFSGVGTFAEADAHKENDFIWSAISDGLASLDKPDWSNGYLIPGLPADGLPAILGIPKG